MALILLLLAGSSACALRDPWQDARIESEVKARLVAEKNANLTRLGVASRQAVVYLSGTVTSADEKALAETVARNVGGVRRVVSALEVRPPAAETGSIRWPVGEPKWPLRAAVAEATPGLRQAGKLATAGRHLTLARIDGFPVLRRTGGRQTLSLMSLLSPLLRE